MAAILILLTFLLPLGAGAEKIIGGHEVKPHSRPYMAFVVAVEASCSMRVTLGAHNISIREDTQQIIPVAKSIPHADYNPMDNSNDIMLLKLERKAKRTKAVRPHSLPRRNVHVKPGDVCYVAGWGKMDPEGDCSNILQEVELTVQKDQECETRFPRCYTKAIEICVGDPKIKRASFKGDSGGPLLCNKAVAGIVSFGYKNGSAPRVFTRVSSFLSWIEKTMKHNELQRKPGPSLTHHLPYN